ncbi:MAG TPA: DUF190 domain-containing protein [Acidimicrobiales bacterium]|nr:DUF190 domain-containing protein [Acidimicrobiales bacterium]
MSGSPPTRAARATILLAPRSHTRHHSTAVELISRARRAKLAGATLLHGLEADRRSPHRHRLLHDDAPLALVIVDEAPALRAFLDSVEPLLGDASVVLEDVVSFRA